MTEEKKPHADLDPAQVAILATLRDAQSLRSNRRAALRAAAELIGDVPKCLDPNPDWEHQTLHERFVTYWAEQDAKEAEAKAWGFTYPVEDSQTPAEGAFSIEQAVEQAWCRFKTMEGLLRFLKRVGYPDRFIELRLITQGGYMVALEREKDVQRAADAEQKRVARSRIGKNR
jgi:hypothetical protein